jgi:hypothetical protein
MTLKTVTGSAVGTQDSLALRKLTHDELQSGTRYITLGNSLGCIPFKNQSQYCVSCGEEIFLLNGIRFTLWANLQLPQTEAEVEELLSSGLNGLAEQEEVVHEWSELKNMHLVVHLPKCPGDILDWHDICPMAQGVGLGEDSETPGVFLVAMQNGELAARVNVAGYLFWGLSNNRRSAREIVDIVCQILGVSQEEGLELLDAPLLFESLLQVGALRLNLLDT